MNRITEFSNRLWETHRKSLDDLMSNHGLRPRGGAVVTNGSSAIYRFIFRELVSKRDYGYDDVD